VKAVANKKLQLHTEVKFSRWRQRDSAMSAAAWRRQRWWRQREARRRGTARRRQRGGSSTAAAAVAAAAAPSANAPTHAPSNATDAPTYASSSLVEDGCDGVARSEVHRGGRYAAAANDDADSNADDIIC